MKNNQIDIFGKIPPQDIQSEMALIACALIDRECINEIVAKIKPHYFYNESHQIIFDVITSMVLNNKGVDLITLTNELRTLDKLDQVGGAFYLSELTTGLAHTVYYENYIDIVRDKYVFREFINISNELQKNAYVEDIDLLHKTISRIDSVLDNNNEGKEILLIDSVKESLHQIKQIIESNKTITGINTGNKKLNRFTSGWQKTDLIILAARPSMGKTSEALEFAKVASLESPVLFFSLEMSHTQLSKRILSGITDKSNTELRFMDINDYNLLHFESNKLTNNKLYIDDTPGLSILEFKARARRAKRKYGIELIVVDYIQLMKGTKDNREQEISEISRTLKNTAKELDIPIIALSQLNRLVEQRTNKRPILSDLRESGAIEQDADMVVFVHRPEKYGILEDENGSSLKGVVELIIAKHRNGALGTVLQRTNDSLTRFYDYDEEFENIF